MGARAPTEDSYNRIITCCTMFDNDNTFASANSVESIASSRGTAATNIGRTKLAPLTFGDLFCGAGGSSEGYRQLGFKGLWAVDNWAPAVETNQRNHPEIEVIQADILKLDPHQLPKVDVLIGSPPCTFFSMSNNGGKGNKEKGMELVYRFLYFVYVLKPKYWVMENVPQLKNHLPDEVLLRSIGVDAPGFFEIPKRVELNSANFGVPQRRRRFFCGHFPEVFATHTQHPETNPGLKPWIPLNHVLNALPDPQISEREGEVQDPNYPFKMPSAELTEQQDLMAITRDEFEEIKQKKQRHSFYGFMAIPERGDLPSRTVVARSNKGRESLLVKTKDGRWFRVLTIRENACLQGYPISYQFWGPRLSDRYMLVGNAVPVGLSRAIAAAILRESGRFIPTPSVRTSVGEKPLPLTPKPRNFARRSKLPIARKFRAHVPSCRQNSHRVDLDNERAGSVAHPLSFANSGFEPKKHLKRWQACLHYGIGKGFLKQRLSVAAVYNEFKTGADRRTMRNLRKFMRTLEHDLQPRIPDASTSQAIWSRHAVNPEENPILILDYLDDFVNRRFPKKEFLNKRLKKSGRIRVTTALGMPVRVAAAAIGAAFIAEVMNHGTVWISQNSEKAYVEKKGLVSSLITPKAAKLRFKNLIAPPRASAQS